MLRFMVGALAFLLGAVVLSQDLRPELCHLESMQLWSWFGESRSIFPLCCTPSRPTLAKNPSRLRCFCHGGREVVDIDRIAAQTQAPSHCSSKSLGREKNHAFFRHRMWSFWPNNLRWIPTTCWASAKVQAPVRSNSFLLTILQRFHRFFCGEDSEDGEETKKVFAKMFDFRLARLIEISACNGIQISNLTPGDLAGDPLAPQRWYMVHCI